jgi:anti-sigma factor (TIGR02949 family)
MAEIDRLTCQEVFERLESYLDRELSPREMQLVIEHLEVCAFCMFEFRFEGRLLDEVRDRLRRITAPPDLLARVRGAIRQTETETESG